MDHMRIDEGVRRGPKRKYPQRKNGLSRDEQGQFIAKLPTDPEKIKAVLQDYADGATFDQLAKVHGVSRQAIYAWTLGNLAPDGCEALIRRSLTARIAKGDALLDNGSVPLDITRGREIARFARMDYERLRPAIYGQAQPSIQVNTQGPVQVNVVSFAASAQTPVIEGTCVEDDVMSKACPPSVLPSPSTE